MSGALAFEVHALTAKLDRAADRLLRSELGTSYRRFLALFAVAELGATMQRSLARHLGVSEASASRMVGVLGDAGLLAVSREAGAGNRRDLALTAEGRRLVDDGKAMLAERLAVLVAGSGIGADAYLRDTRRLSAALDEAERAAAGAPRR